MPEADITILGAGPVGCTLALLLARHAADPARIVLCAATPRGAAAGARDPRALALNHGSRLLLQGLDAWPASGAAIHTVHVSQRGRLGRTLIRNADFGVSELGTVQTYIGLQSVLRAALLRAGVTVRDGGEAAIVGATADGVRITQDSHAWSTALAVQAEGRVADTDASVQVEREYGQHAILATMRASRPAPGWAWERFTQEGPLALLPVQAGDTITGDTYSLVWCCTPERAESLRTLSDAAFSQAVSTEFGERMGRLTCISDRHTHPLRMRWRRNPVTGPRRVALGNAAQSLHPVAGQGLNLGLRDAARLAQALAPWQITPDRDPAPWVAEFDRLSRADRSLTTLVTDTLSRIFTTRLLPVEHVCGLALLTLDIAAPLRHPFTRHLLQGLRT